MEATQGPLTSEEKLRCLRGILDSVATVSDEKWEEAMSSLPYKVTKLQYMHISTVIVMGSIDEEKEKEEEEIKQAAEREDTSMESSPWNIFKGVTLGLARMKSRDKKSNLNTVYETTSEASSASKLGKSEKDCSKVSGSEKAFVSTKRGNKNKEPETLVHEISTSSSNQSLNHKTSSRNSQLSEHPSEETTSSTSSSGLFKKLRHSIKKTVKKLKAGSSVVGQGSSSTKDSLRERSGFPSSEGEEPSVLSGSTSYKKFRNEATSISASLADAGRPAECGSSSTFHLKAVPKIFRGHRLFSKAPRKGPQAMEIEEWNKEVVFRVLELLAILLKPYGDFFTMRSGKTLGEFLTELRAEIGYEEADSDAPSAKILKPKEDRAASAETDEDLDEPYLPRAEETTEDLLDEIYLGSEDTTEEVLDDPKTTDPANNETTWKKWAPITYIAKRLSKRNGADSSISTPEDQSETGSQKSTSTLNTSFIKHFKKNN